MIAKEIKTKQFWLLMQYLAKKVSKDQANKKGLQI